MILYEGIALRSGQSSLVSAFTATDVSLRVRFLHLNPHKLSSLFMSWFLPLCLICVDLVRLSRWWWTCCVMAERAWML